MVTELGHISGLSRRLRLLAALALATGAACCPSAVADSNLIVSQHSGADSGDCQNHPCRTIAYALVQAATLGGTATLTVAPGDYDEDLTLPQGLAVVQILGTGDGADPATNTLVTGSSGAPTIETAGVASVSLSNLRIVNPPGDAEDLLSAPVATLSLTHLSLDQQAEEGDAIDAQGGNVKATDSTIVLSDPTGAGYAINDRGGDISVENSTILLAGLGYGVNAIEGAVKASHSTIELSNSESWGFAINTLGAVAANDDVIAVAGRGFGSTPSGRSTWTTARSRSPIAPPTRSPSSPRARSRRAATGSSWPAKAGSAWTAARTCR